ncbi:hypothetical protein [Sphingomonas sp. CARO-RG-8B-R24-01]|uniref:hypothetical protein n=1 Tax=Sphingomonas sp. CARO-RG-8B-R24-01 TaxID=2914831 RepID=UPI001F59BE30|nr:hypothetical protein [Sphingomonas sp. CARO-RG-8B-R24-01]
MQRAMLAMAAVLAIGGCARTPQPPFDDSQKLVRATLKILTDDGNTICVDNRTNGKPLAIFATMSVAPPPSRRPLAWHVVTPLRSNAALTARQIYQDTIVDKPAHIPDPVNATPALGFLDQQRLNSAAMVLSRTGQSKTVDLGGGFGVPRVDARWWPLVRLSQKCYLKYVISDPVWSDTMGFVTINIEHWGTTYAFQRRNNDWVAVAQWSNWLF